MCVTERATTLQITFSSCLNSLEGVIQVFRIVENALAGIARDDLVVLSNFLKHLRPDANLADLTDIVTSRRKTDSSAEFANSFIPRQEIAGYLNFDILALGSAGLHRTDILLVFTLEFAALLIHAL